MVNQTHLQGLKKYLAGRLAQKLRRECLNELKTGLRLR
jgi:hypothetical protein